MAAILQLIYCWLQEFWCHVAGVYLSVWDAFLNIADAMLTSIGPIDLALPTIASDYAWMIGALGFSQAIGIFCTAWLVRFMLQMIPFVRWGS